MSRHYAAFSAATDGSGITGGNPTTTLANIARHRRKSDCYDIIDWEITDVEADGRSKWRGQRKKISKTRISAARLKL